MGLGHDTALGVADRSPGSRPSRWPTMSLGAATGSYGMAMAMFSTTASLFLADAVRVGPIFIGVYFTGCAVASVGANLVTGWLSDRLNDRRVALALTALAGVAGAVTFIAVRNYAVIFATGAVLLSINNAFLSQLLAYVKEFVEFTGRKLTPFTSAMRSVLSAGWIIGPPAGFFLLVHTGFKLMYMSIAGLLLVTALLSRWFVPALPSPPKPTAEDIGNSQARWLRRLLATVPGPTRLLLGSVTAVYVADQMYLIAIALYVTKTLHLSAALVGLMAGISAAFEIPLMIAVGRVADRIGKLRIVTVGALLAAIFFCLLPVANSAPVLIALQLPNALSTAAISISMVIVLQEIPGGTGSASSLYSSVITLAQLLAGAITGVVAALVGYRNVFWVCGGACVLATALLLARRISRPSDSRKVTQKSASGNAGR
jgi:MFS transporter, SET family, sugar efflux transporter